MDLELFLGNTGISIHEENWGKPYAARLERWLVPSCGAPERKITERMFTIEGWRR